MSGLVKKLTMSSVLAAGMALSVPAFAHETDNNVVLEINELVYHAVLGNSPYCIGGHIVSDHYADSVKAGFDKQISGYNFYHVKAEESGSYLCISKDITKKQDEEKNQVEDLNNQYSDYSIRDQEIGNLVYQAKLGLTEFCAGGLPVSDQYADSVKAGFEEQISGYTFSHVKTESESKLCITKNSDYSFTAIYNWMKDVIKLL